jgi:hypothetical protein
MKRTIYDCWKCRHHNSDNPYGIDYCEAHDTRCSFAHDDCDDFEPNDGGNDHQQHPPCRLTLIGWYLLAIVTALLLGLLLTGCTTTKYVPVVEHKTDTLLKYSSTRDSIYVHDSIHVHERGDTVLVERWHTRWRDRWHSDTVYRARIDSVPVPYPVEVKKEVPRERSTVKWVLLIIGLLAIVWILFRIATTIKHV